MSIVSKNILCHLLFWPFLTSVHSLSSSAIFKSAQTTAMTVPARIMVTTRRTEMVATSAGSKVVVMANRRSNSQAFEPSHTISLSRMRSVRTAFSIQITTMSPNPPPSISRKRQREEVGLQNSQYKVEDGRGEMAAMIESTNRFNLELPIRKWRKKGRGGRSHRSAAAIGSIAMVNKDSDKSSSTVIGLLLPSRSFASSVIRFEICVAKSSVSIML